MRNAFADEITSLAEKDKRIIMLSADIGNKLFDKFKEKNVGRFFNTGVAEANTISVGAGLALSGLKPIAYTITPFITMRCFEQIKIDVCYNDAPVVIVGVGSGLGYSALGVTHHSLEDISILRSLPNMTVLCPADQFEVRVLLRNIFKYNKPVYFRLGKKGEQQVHKEMPELEIGKAKIIEKGKKICMISTGTILPVVLEVHRKLKSMGIGAEVVNMHTVKPLDKEYLKNAFDCFDAIVVIEEHSVIGGLSSAVSEFMADNGKCCKLVRFGTNDTFMHNFGEQHYARHYYGLDSDSIHKRLCKELKLK